MIVAKFGGSSVRDAEAMKQVASVVASNKFMKLVIISATYNTTNQLEFVAQAALRGDETVLNSLIKELETKHLTIAKDLETSIQGLNELNMLFTELKALGFQISKDKSYTPKTMDVLYSLGERMSSLLISDYLRKILPDRHVIFFDARKIIKTNSDYNKAEPQIDLIYDLAQDILLKRNTPEILYVTQGFIGEDLQGHTTTLGREGSDYSAALFGEAIRASEIQIWTDVPGVASTDPRICSEANYLAKISYDEATALATLGAKVLFPRTLEPAKRHSIPVFVGSTKNPEAGGTYVVRERDHEFHVKALSVLKKENNHFLVSLIGSELHTKKDLTQNFIKYLAQGNFHAEAMDLTAVSLSVQVVSEEKDRLQQYAHGFLKTV